MKTSLNNEHHAAFVRPWACLAAAILLLAAYVIPSLAGPPVVSNKKDGGGWRMSWWLGGWQGDGGSDKLYFWMDFGPWNSVFRQTPDGLYWFHDSKSKGTVVIASAGPGEDANTPPHDSDIRYVGVGSMVDTGFWKENENDPSLVDPTEKMTWTIKATVKDVVTEEEWRLEWHLVLRDGKWNETYRFEPVK